MPLSRVYTLFRVETTYVLQYHLYRLHQCGLTQLDRVNFTPKRSASIEKKCICVVLPPQPCHCAHSLIGSQRNFAFQPGLWHFIVDLSSPPLANANEGIATDLCSLSYVRVDEAARLLLQLGPGALMAKLDLESAYRQIPVHPDDLNLLGVR